MNIETSELPYEGLRGRDGRYLADRSLIDAANVALALGAPLLLTGEPGCGKTEFAFVAANALAGSGGALPLECYIRSDARARELLYHYNALLRFTEGHHGGDVGRRRAEDTRHYIELQPLGVALTSPVRRVLLIDEIDKAPRDVPNDLLRELDRGQFEIAEIPASYGRREPVADCNTGTPLWRIMKRPDGAAMPLVVITSNVERQLPDPFLRRCVFYHIEFPGETRLRAIVRERFENLDPEVLDKAIQIFLAARKIPNLTKRPSTAELLHWVQALGLFPAERVRKVFAFADSLDSKGRGTHATLRWRDVLGVGCLFKMREDQAAANAWCT